MSTDSVPFALFLAAAFLLYRKLPFRAGKYVILAANCGFYLSFGVKAGLIFLPSILLAYLAGRQIASSDNAKKQKLIFRGYLVLSVGLLALFKYAGFLTDMLSSLLSRPLPRLQSSAGSLLAPLGISFYTFETVSYVADVFRGRIPAEWDFGLFAAYVSFFPTVTSGPIERAENLLPQLRENAEFSYSAAAYGIKLIVWGFFKKYVIADTLAEYADRILSDVYLYSGSALLYASLFFTFQIYCDFSGYTDIARGIAGLFGIRLSNNFRSPYFSSSVKEFWGRWHISLSTWLRDYIYIPLGGNRAGKAKHYFNILITFLLSGLWHGASWTFVFWGALHGVAQILENAAGVHSAAGRKGLRYWGKTLLVFVFVSFAWIFFKMPDVSQALYVITHMFDGISSPLSYFAAGKWAMDLRMYRIVLLGFSLALLALYDYFALEHDVIAWISSQKRIVRYPVYFLLSLICLLFRSVGNVGFLYSNF